MTLTAAATTVAGSYPIVISGTTSGSGASNGIKQTAPVTLVVGSVLAIVQKDLKRMLAYSSISQAGYVLVGQSSAVTLSVSNTGNAYLAASNRATNNATYNLNGSVTGGNSVFVGTAASISLQDSNYTGTGGQTSASYAYTFKPTVTGAASTAVTTTFTNGFNNTNGGGSVTSVLSGTGVAPVQSVAPTSPTYVRVGTTGTPSVVVGNIGNGNLAGTGTAFNLNGSVTNALGTGFASTNSGSISLASNATSTTGSTATSTLGYTYTPTARGAAVTSAVTLAFTNGNSNGTNLSQSVAATLTGVGVGPVYASATSIAGGSVTTNTPTVKGTLGAAGPAGATISFGTLGYKQSDTIYLELQNTTTDSAAGALLTDLTIDKYSITGANASSVSVSSLTNGAVITEGGMLLVPITVVGAAGSGVLNSSLTIFTDESVALGGSGDSFTYALTAIDVPEPATLAVLGAGLAGLASFRRRRR